MVAGTRTRSRTLAKSLTGIRGLDEVTAGGLPRGRTTLLVGSAGAGKTLVATEYLARGAEDLGEPGVLLSFDEPFHELAANAASIGIDLRRLRARKLLATDFVELPRSVPGESGPYDLGGLFIRLELAIKSVAARRVVIDGVDTLFAGFTSAATLRSELQRLFRWLKAQGVTSVVTAERGTTALTRHGFEEYLSDCVVVLDHRVASQTATRRLRVVKYRGSRHGTNEYPFLIGDTGVSVLPITSLGMARSASKKTVSSGIAGLDALLDARGFYRGSSIVVTGTAGTGKSSIAARFVDAACRRGERCLYVGFEEGESEIIRNLRSVGLRLDVWKARGKLRILTAPATSWGIERHLAEIDRKVEEFQPQVVVLDPISSLVSVGEPMEVRALLARLVDMLKHRHATILCTDLAPGGTRGEGTGLLISSLADVWIVLRNTPFSHERGREVCILKARGMGHRTGVHELRLSRRGVEIVQRGNGNGTAARAVRA